MLGLCRGMLFFGGDSRDLGITDNGEAFPADDAPQPSSGRSELHETVEEH